jgi:hypothetical protein
LVSSTLYRAVRTNLTGAVIAPSHTGNDAHRLATSMRLRVRVDEEIRT